MKNSDGFSLVEVIISLMILSMTIAVIIPALNMVFTERKTIREERVAEEMIHRIYMEFFYEGVRYREEKIIFENTEYNLKIRDEARFTYLCVSWEGVNRREYERCLSGKKIRDRNDFNRSID